MCEREEEEVGMVVWVISAAQLGRGVVGEGRVLMLLWFWHGHKFIEIRGRERERLRNMRESEDRECGGSGCRQGKHGKEVKTWVKMVGK